MRRTSVIAEIGENHVGDWERARAMVVAAAKSGADIVKFQSYRGSVVSSDDPEKEWFTRVELPDEVHFELLSVAEEHGVEFLSSPFTLERAKFLNDKMKLKAVKIASSELLNWSLLDYVNTWAETVYLSTGMATLEEVREAVGHLPRVGRVVIMHCVTQYPAKHEDVNLRAITTLQESFPHNQIGYSDHTLGLLAPIAAVALGCSVIEKHFTMDRSLPGTDHALSATPDELCQMIQQIQQVERLLGSALKQPTESEMEIRQFVRTRFPKE